MAQAVAWVIGAVKSFVISVGAKVGLSAAASLAISKAALNLAISAAIGAANTPSIPDPEGSKFNVRQPRPVRRYGVGTCRVSGASMLYEAELNILHQVIAFPEGPVGHWGTTWLNDDEVTVTAGVVQQLADGRYKTGLVLLQDRKGLETETAYASLVTQYGAVWTSLHRGDGIPSAWLRCQGGSLNVFNKTYPGGPPVLTREAFFVAYDWRLDSTSGGSGSHRRDDPTTWEETNNPVVWTVNILWRRYGQDWDRRFAPALDVLTDEADVCDENVTLKAGGTVDRYKVGFWFEAPTPIKVFLTAMLAAMDGHFSVRRDGAFIIRAGHYVAPTIIFGDDEIIDWSFDPGPAPDAVINVLMCSFVDPTKAYSQVDCAPWRDETSITTHGERPQDFFPQGVQSQSQVRRLAKAAMDRNASGSGSFKTPLSARRGMGERFIGIRCSDVDDLNDVVVEIMDVSLDLASASITWTYKLANANRYDWTAAAEEGDPPDSQDRPAPVADEAPEITTITPFFESLGTGGEGVRLNVVGTGPDRDDLTWFIQWRSPGATSWHITEVTDEDASSGFEGNTGFVPADAALEVQIGYRTGGGFLVWSATETVNASAPVVSLDFLAGRFINGLATANSIAALEGWTYSRAGVGYAETVAGGLVAFAADTPRVTDKGLLSEAAATNLIAYSCEIDNAAWTKSGSVTVTANHDAGPDGTASVADRIEFGAGTCYVQKTSAVGLTNGAPCTLTFWAKSNSGTPTIGLRSGVSGLSATRVLTASWARYSWTFNAGGTDEVIQIADAGLVAGASGTADFEIWGVQLETGSAASSFIPTTTAAVTRAADVATLTIPAGDAADALTATWSGAGSDSFARSDLVSATVLDLGGAALVGGVLAGWVGHYIETVELIAA